MSSASASSEGRVTLAASLGAAAVAALVLVLVSIASGNDARHDDNLASTAPLIATSVRLWSEGTPFWNPYHHFGEALVPQILAEPLYPPGLAVGAIFALEDVPQAWVVIHAALAAAGAAFLARTIGRSGRAAFVAGTSFGLGAPLLYVAKCWMVIGLSPAWTPWVIALLLRARRGSVASVGLAGLALGLLVHSGGVEGALWGSILAIALCVFDQSGDQSGDRLRGLFKVATALALGVLLASPIVLETLAALKLSNRAAPVTGGVEVEPEMIFGVVLPTLPSRSNLPWSDALARSTPLYQGFVPHLLLLCAFSWKRANAVERVFGVTTALALFFVLGKNTGADRIVNAIPVIANFHHPIGRLHLVGLGVSILAASAFDALDGVKPKRVAVASASLLGSSLAIALLTRTFGAASIVLFGAALLVTIGCNFVRETQRRNLVVAATPLLLAFQLALSWTSVSDYRPRTGSEVAPVAARARASQGRVAVVLAEQELLHLPLLEALGRDEAGALGFPSTAGYTVLFRPEIGPVWGLLPMGEAVLARWEKLLDSSLLEASGVERVHGSASLAALVRAGHGASRLREESHTDHTITFVNLQYRGRAYRVGRALGSKQEPPDLDRSDLLEIALVSSSSTLAGRTFGRGPVKAFREKPGLVSIEVEPVSEPSLLVVTTSWAPGFRASVDGRSVACERAQCGLCALELPPGARAVELSYESLPLRIGLVLALVGLAGAVGAIVAEFLRRARSPK